MKAFWNRYSYNTVKLFINQFAISIFGAMLSFVAVSIGNSVLTIVLSAFSALFYLFLIYTLMWEVGATDKISVDVGKRPYRPFTGLYMALFANIPNFLVALIFTAVHPFSASYEWAGNICGVLKGVAFIPLHGIYNGIMMVLKIGDTALHDFWWAYFLMTLPSLFVCFMAYYLGHRNFKFFGFITSPKKGRQQKIMHPLHRIRIARIRCFY